MQICSACQKAPATIVIMDLHGGSLTGQQQLCSECAESMGVVQPKMTPKMSVELLEDLLGGMTGKGGANRRRETACPACGMAAQEFKQKGRLGCPRCYEAFRGDLVPLLQRVHEAASHRGRLPANSPSLETTGTRAAADPAAATSERASSTERLAELRRRLEDAVRGERYEEAARLRDDLRRAEKGEDEVAP